MTKVIVDTKNFLNFLTSFSKGVPDLRIDCAGSRITIEVAYAWYYLRKQYIPVSIEEEGALHIADLDKVIKFFKATKNSQVTMRQVSPKKPLHLVAGGNKLQLPSTDDIESGIKAVVIRKLLKNCEQSGWSKLGESYFGEWLPSCLQFLDEGNARMHLGIETPVIFEQDNTLLFILDESDD